MLKYRKLNCTSLYPVSILLLILFLSTYASADAVDNLQTLINNNASNGTSTIIAHNYNSANAKIIYLPDNAMIEGNGYNLQNISLCVGNSSNVYIHNVLFKNTIYVHDWWDENLFPIINIRGNGNNITISDCTIDNIRTWSVGIYIYPGNLSNITIKNTTVNNTDDHGYMIFSRDINPTVTNISFINDTANQNGLYVRQNAWPVGFDFGETEQNTKNYTLQITNMLVDNCSASYNWESGFHIEHGIYTQNFTIRNCKSNHNGQKTVPDYGAGYTLCSPVNAKNNSANSNYIGYYLYDGIEACNSTTDRSITLNNNTDANNRLYGLFLKGSSKHLNTASINVCDHYSQNAGSLGSFVYQIHNLTFKNVSIINPKSTKSYSVLFQRLYDSTIDMNYVNMNNRSSVGVLVKTSANDTFSGNYFHNGNTALKIQSIDTHSNTLPIINIKDVDVTSQKYGIQISSVTGSITSINNATIRF